MNYTFHDPKTGKTFDITMSYDEYLEYVKKHPHFEQHFTPPGLVDPVRIGRKKPDGWLQDRLKAIKKGNKHSNIDLW